MNRNLGDFDESKDKLEEKTPYGYDEYCKKFKGLDRFIHLRRVNLILISIGILVFLMASGYLFNKLFGVTSEVAVDEGFYLRNEENDTEIITEVADKGVLMQLNSINFDGKQLTAKMTLDYTDIDDDILSNKKENIELLSKGYFEIYSGNKRMKTFPPSIESSYSQDVTNITIKMEMNSDNPPTGPIRLEYKCNKLEVLSKSEEAMKIEGNWGFTYNIKNISDIEQGSILKIGKKLSLVNDDINMNLNFDYILFKNGNTDLVYRYENKSKRELNNSYNLEIKVYDHNGTEISSLTNNISGANKEEVKRVSPLKIDDDLEEITIKTMITKDTLFSGKKVVIDSLPVDVILNKTEDKIVK